jgi:CRP/FNR family cyclic AMP-dependent transcriptional regulator
MRSPFAIFRGRSDQRRHVIGRVGSAGCHPRAIIRQPFTMSKTTARPLKTSEIHPDFDVEAFLESAGAPQRIATYPKGKVVFSQGQPTDSVMYIQKGGVKLSVLSRAGKEAVVAMLGPGDFFGEGALIGQSIRIGTATATTLTTVLVIEKEAMLRLLHDEPTFSNRFISFMLARNLRIEADLVDQLFNSSEKRLARTLLLLARYGDQAGAKREIPQISQETLAEMIGTTRSRVNFFMNKFRDLGFIEYNGGLTINTSLLSIVLHD